MIINAFLACRLGSNRIKFKNLLLLKGKPLFSYLTEAAIKCKKINNLYLNTDSQLIIDVAKTIFDNKIKYFLRDPNLGTSETALDDYVYDFMIKFPGEITIFLNPCSLFLQSKTIDKAINHFIDKDLDSCCASQISQTHCFYKNKSINFDSKSSQPRSQDLEPVHCMTSGFFIWKNKTFIESYEKNFSANFCGKFQSFGVSSFEAIDIDNYEDLELAEKFLSKKPKKLEYEYHPLVADLIKNKLVDTN